MDYTEFLEDVRTRARLGTKDEALAAARATLEVLALRLFRKDGEILAHQLPPEVGLYMLNGKEQERFDLIEFFKRVGREESVDLPEAVRHVRGVVSVLLDTLSPDLIEDIRMQLPGEYGALFGPENMVNESSHAWKR